MAEKEKSQRFSRRAREKQILESYCEIWPKIEGWLRVKTPREFLDEALSVTRHFVIQELVSGQRPKEQQKPYCYGIARNVRNQILRNADRTKLLFVDTETLNRIIETATSAATKSEHEVNLVAATCQVLKKLSKRCRTLLLERYQVKKTTLVRFCEEDNYWARMKATSRCLKKARELGKQLLTTYEKE